MSDADNEDQKKTSPPALPELSDFDEGPGQSAFEPDDLADPLDFWGAETPIMNDGPPPLPSLGLDDEAALDVTRPMSPGNPDDSDFEPETVFDAEFAANTPSPPRELEIAPENETYVPRVGEVLNERFEIVKLIAVGSLGAVYLVRDLRLKDLKALKLMHSDLIKDGAAANRFIEEIKTLQKLSHEHIVRVYDFGKTDRGDLSFFTMEHVEGTNLAALLKKKGGRLPLDKTLTLIYQMLDTLTYAHRHGAFRNLKPLNVIVRPSGKVVLLNFGISGAAKELAGDRRGTLGTYYYRAPEQSRDPSISTPQVDLYSIGVLFYQMLTGTVPTGDAKPPSRLNRALPRRLDSVIMRCLSVQAEARYQSAEQLKAAIRRAVRPPIQGLLPAGIALVVIAVLLIWWLYG